MQRYVTAVAVGCVALCLGAAIAFADEPDPKKMTVEQRLVKGKDLIDSICFWCHEPELMKTKQLNQEQWSELIRPMVYEGAPVTDEEFKMIVEYLAKTFGPENQKQ